MCSEERQQESAQFSSSVMRLSLRIIQAENGAVLPQRRNLIQDGRVAFFEARWEVVAAARGFTGPAVGWEADEEIWRNCAAPEASSPQVIRHQDVDFGSFRAVLSNRGEIAKINEKIFKSQLGLLLAKLQLQLVIFPTLMRLLPEFGCYDSEDRLLREGLPVLQLRPQMFSNHVSL